MERPPDDPGRRGAVAIVMRDGRMLVIRRSPTVVAPGAICFPGGGIEPNESEEEAIIREFREEIGVTVRPLRPIWRCVTPWKVKLSWWSAEMEPDAVPVPNPAEVAAVEWLTVDEMVRSPDLLESNREFLDLVRQGKIELGGSMADDHLP
ncbi:MAG: NUDIX domain-containing protein [Thermoguttaceae bacterium]